MEKMLIKAGKSVYDGIAIGKIHVFQKEKLIYKEEKVIDRTIEIERFKKAKDNVLRQLETLHKKALSEVGEDKALIFEIHQMLLDDPDYTESIECFIKEKGINAEAAVYLTGERIAKVFSEMKDPYFCAREADIRDISSQLLKSLGGYEESQEQIKEPIILVADDLTPSETVGFDKNLLLGIVTKGGSINSHTAILARSMGIPALVNVDFDVNEGIRGSMAAIDSTEGTFYIHPNEDTLKKLVDKKEKMEKEADKTYEMIGKETVTISGKRVMLYANIGSDMEAGTALEKDAEGIGLFRSEFLFLGRDCMPEEEEQYEAYKNVLQKMKNKRVIIRTLDIGADKQVSYIGMDAEENPAMGVRGIRLCLAKPELFKVQLRALLRAAVHGKLAIMIPFVCTVSEILQTKTLIEETKKELAKENLEYGETELGIMIETPSAAVISDLLATHVDFFSIGTNDLIQYILAADRQNGALEPLLEGAKEAVMRLISMTVEHAHANGIWCGICGEMAADLSLTKTFLDMQIDELSVSPAFLLKLREKIRSCE